MSDEFFYGVTLSADKKETIWNPLEKEDEGEYPPAHAYKLIVKQILLGSSAKSDEFNTIEVETMAKDEEIKIPIAVLKSNENRYANLFLEFPDPPVKFRLTEGSGPVHIVGQHLTGDLEEDLDMEEEDLDEEDCDNEIKADMKSDDDEPKSKKLKIGGNNIKKEKNHKKK